MQLARLINPEGRPEPSVLLGQSYAPIPENISWTSAISFSMQEEGRDFLLDQASSMNKTATGSLEGAAPVALTSAPIWGAGLNYKRHSTDLETEQPLEGPGSYLRPGNCLINNSGIIQIPAQSERVTAEGELGLVLGKTAKDVPAEDWRSVVAGLTAVLDMTAEDAIRKNPRYIPWAKGFDTFCSVGPQIVTLDEFADEEIASIKVATICDDHLVAEARVSDMKYNIGKLVAYFSAGRTLPAGTIICTGTPGATVIEPGSNVTASVSSIGQLSHPVK